MQNPLRLRLTSHLQCCAAQRELATKQPAPTPPWSYPAAQPYTSLNTLPPSPASNHMPIGNLGIHQQPSSSLHHQNVHHDLTHFDTNTSCPSTLPSSSDVSARLAPVTTVLSSVTTAAPSALGYSPHQYQPNGFNVPTSSHHQSYNQNNPGTQGMKPYRPWGAEVAY